MAGRGRGAASFTFNIEALGIGRGSMPDARVGPSPLFPTTDFKPVPLKAGEEEDYMLALKQELRGAMQRLPYNIKPLSNRAAEVEKYTQRYIKQSQRTNEEWTPDWNLLPKELMPRKRRVGAEAGTTKKTRISQKVNQDILNKLEDLEKKDRNPEKSDDETEKKAENEEEEVEEEEFEEEDIEEENDYIDSYFDNGEDFAAGSDENIDGEATY
ncbi:DNA-directed RNA polymerase III subunit RPC7 isoform X3 [Takifugu rubripes]|uniref:DNA-directed RNA polymerase III subunit RPC7 isoform X3 n=1 Tax=Takifugu rubripes TaxID=31033 RepID=UPI001145ED4A|nr:DNA-directed RNA polymerase III subunit RPC7 isoform X3 [Takifugu rubripes]XP_011614350.2 DNA-directed RNA polymerase III subunit RPC7 isoform X3 [Takifugu rubripes]XP_011614351.2 DNA-directed RNA polymerase III subunit RPC7 isoform X3 [Takifugu rubripes]